MEPEPFFGEFVPHYVRSTGEVEFAAAIAEYRRAHRTNTPVIDLRPACD